jgi:lipoprotein-anchoring transpeptidase ErfK/SrfK
MAQGGPAPIPTIFDCRMLAFVALSRACYWGPANNLREVGMLSRIVASVLWAVAVAAASSAVAAPPQRNYDHTVAGQDPVARFFGFSSSPIPRTTVSYPGKLKPGSIVISTRERRLYFILGNGQALRYGIGVGREGFAWSGASSVSAKREWPDWTPPEQMLKRRPDLPKHMAGGPENPLGARALYLGASLYRIHGSNEPQTIGQQVSSGCIRLTNEDIIDLYNRTRLGATVIVQQ